MMRLSPAMTWSRHGNDVYVYGESQVLQLRNCPPEADALLRLLEAGCEPAAIDTVDIEPARAAEVLDWLRETNCLVRNGSHRWVGTPWERQTDYFCALGADPDEAQAILATARVAILGVGGIGSIVLAHLVSAGVSRYTLIDSDVVSPHNLNRQFIYAASDVGRLKVDAAADWIAARNPSAVISTFPQMVAHSADLVAALQDRVSLVVSAADSPFDIGLSVARACLETQTPLVGADCGLRTASWGPLLEPADIPAYLSALETIGDWSPVPRASEVMTASFGPTNAIVASYLAKDVVNWFAGLPVVSRRKKMIIDFDACTTEMVDTREPQQSGLDALSENT